MKKVDKIDEFTKYVIDEAGLETPSKNFMADVLKKVQKESIKAAIPLISYKVWWLIGIAISAVCIYFILYWQNAILFNYSHVYEDYLLSLNSLYSGLPGIEFSNTFTWCFLLFGVLLFTQVLLIKNYSKKRMNLD